MGVLCLHYQCEVAIVRLRCLSGVGFYLLLQVFTSRSTLHLTSTAGVSFQAWKKVWVKDQADNPGSDILPTYSSHDLVPKSRYRFAMVLSASTLLPVYQSPDVPCVRRKMLIRLQPLHILILQTNRNRNLTVRRPRHKIDQALDRLELRSADCLRFAQSEVEIEMVAVYFRPGTEREVYG